MQLHGICLIKHRDIFALTSVNFSSSFEVLLHRPSDLFRFGIDSITTYAVSVWSDDNCVYLSEDRLLHYRDIKPGTLQLGAGVLSLNRNIRCLALFRSAIFIVMMFPITCYETAYHSQVSHLPDP
jgi:hypothetical protein